MLLRRVYGLSVKSTDRSSNFPELHRMWPQIVHNAIEEALIASYRRDTGESPTANFGIIPGYRRSSDRSGGFIGGILEEGESEPNCAPGTGPLPWTDADAMLSDSWMGLDGRNLNTW